MLNEYILGNMSAGVRAPGRACVRACLLACAAMRACAGKYFAEEGMEYVCRLSSSF